jgi:hypothetical protein
MKKPDDLFARVQEWSDLTDFAESTAHGLRLGVVYGRRRQGKSYLLRRLAQAHDAFYHQAQELSRVPALQRFADEVAAKLGLSAGQLQFPDWETAFRTALGVPKHNPLTSGIAGPSRLLIIDELPYLLNHSPEIPSVLQELWDELRETPSAVIVCGSALSVMTDLLSGQQALRGRAQLDLKIQPFDYLTAAQFWGATDAEVALRIGAIMGETPGYRALISQPTPQNKRGLPQWLAKNILNPAHALYQEMGYLLREDPRIQDKALYNSILRTIAAGATTASKIGAALGRTDRSVQHPLEVLLTAGFLRREEDVLLQRRATYQIADPIVRFTQLVLEPQRTLLEERLVEQAWSAAYPSFSAGVLGPHFERVAVHWTAKYAIERWSAPIGEVGHTVVNDPAGRSQHELDVVGLPQGMPKQTSDPRIIVLGEAKSSNRLRTLSDLERLDHIRALLNSRGVDAREAALVLFGRSGFHHDLKSETNKRGDVHLIDLKDLFPPSSPTT